MQLVSISSALKAVSFSGMQMDLFIEPGICLNSDGSGALDRTHHPWDQEFVGGLGLSEFWEPLRWHRRPQNDEGTASALIMLHERSFLLLRPKSVTPGPQFPRMLRASKVIVFWNAVGAAGATSIHAYQPRRWHISSKAFF